MGNSAENLELGKSLQPPWYCMNNAQRWVYMNPKPCTIDLMLYGCRRQQFSTQGDSTLFLLYKKMTDNIKNTDL